MSRIKLDEVQTITGKDGRPTHAVVPWPVWIAITDAIDSDEALFRGVPSDEETFPADVAKRLVAGESPIKVFREHRGLTQAKLAEHVGSTAAYVSQIESGARRAGDDMLRLIARALKVEYEEIAMAALPTVKNELQPPRWNGKRGIVSCFLVMRDSETIPQVGVSVQALEHLERADALSGPEALSAYERHRPRIWQAASRAIAEGRRQRDGVLLLVSADFQGT